MNIKTFADKISLGEAAAEQAAGIIRQSIAAHNRARIIAATGNSQVEFLNALTSSPGIDWKQVEVFHLDEYLNLSLAHPASFRKYLLERLINPVGIQKYHLLDGEKDPQFVIKEVGAQLNAAQIDVAFVGIGENGHLAFNDPPADFETEEPYLVVNLDEACRQQQVGEGWFAQLSEVPQQAISMSIRQILKAREIICVVPDSRKAKAVKMCLQEPVSGLAPASILRTHPRVTLYLDQNSAALL
ncbi:MAG: glucosamine-6-phosphate deaminase [Pyrinomonadaceae bacterium]